MPGRVEGPAFIFQKPPHLNLVILSERNESKDLRLPFVLYQGMSLLMPQPARPSFK
jgi:hypothetical protein